MLKIFKRKKNRIPRIGGYTPTMHNGKKVTAEESRIILDSIAEVLLRVQANEHVNKEENVTRK